MFYAFPNDHVVLIESDRTLLAKPVAIGEVQSTLKTMPIGKSVGPDGLNIDFYLFYWDFVKLYLFQVVSYFSQPICLLKSWSKTYIVLIPKKDNPRNVIDFKPISLYNVSCKMISKIHTNRLMCVIHHLIGAE